MKLARFEVDGEVHHGLVEGDTVSFLPASLTDILAGRAEPTPTGEMWPLEAVRLLAPIPDPGTVYAIGLNYADHIAELSKPGAPREAGEKPVVFLKAAGSINAPAGPVKRPAVTEQLDYEAELVVVIGTGGEPAGYCVANDVSARDLQNTEPQWTRAKGADGFCPYGPWITIADEIPDPHALWIRSWVNGELRQDAQTSQLLFDIPTLVAFIAETNRLAPGDLILTGTPAGVGAGMDPPRFLQPGDRVRIEVERLGAIEHEIV